MEKIKKYFDEMSVQWGMIALENNTSAIIILRPYQPFLYDPNEYYVDAYYYVSNKEYFRSKQICADINKIKPELNARTHGVNDLPLKTLASLCGAAKCGFQNTLSYTKDYGSYFYIQAILVDGEYSVLNQSPTISCLNCGKCIKACPTKCLDGKGGIDADKCLRRLMANGQIEDDKIAKQIGTSISGCFRCQQACPLNKPPEQYVGADFLCAVDKALQDLDITYFINNFGKNYATKTRMINLIINACGNAGKLESLHNIANLATMDEFQKNAKRVIQKIEK